MPLHLPTLLFLTTKACRKIMHALNFQIVKMAAAASISEKIKLIPHASSSYFPLSIKYT